MPDENSLNQLTDSLSAPLGDLIAAVGRGVAEAQQALDTGTLAAVRTMYDTTEGDIADMRRLGYRPTWYQIPEVDAEITVSLSVSGQSSSSGVGGGGPAAGRVKLYAAPIDATFRNRYDFDLKAASTVKFRIVPVPPSPAASDVKAVPSLDGKTYLQARELLADLDIVHEHSGSGSTADEALVLSFSPAAGSLVSSDQAVTLTT
jgi:hypothetical protein